MSHFEECSSIRKVTVHLLMDPLIALPISEDCMQPRCLQAASGASSQPSSRLELIREMPHLPSTKCKPVPIKQVLRPMRGGSQSYLVEAEDRRFYVAKFQNNPQGNRTLLNEWIGSQILRACGISAPEVQILELTPAVVRSNPNLCFHFGRRLDPIKAGLHVGSHYPVHPNRIAVFDFIPERLLDFVVNLEDFVRVYVIDHLLGQADTRQVVFTRERKSWTKVAFRAWMIDHGMLFGGAEWKIRDIPSYGLYFDRTVYSRIDFWPICHEVIGYLQSVVAEVFWSSVHSAPAEWFGVDNESDLKHLFRLINARLEKWLTIIELHKTALDDVTRNGKQTFRQFAPAPNLAPMSEIALTGTFG